MNEKKIYIIILLCIAALQSLLSGSRGMIIRNASNLKFSYKFALAITNLDITPALDEYKQRKVKENEMVRTEEVAVKIADAIFQERLGPDYLHDLPLHIYDDKTNGTWVVCNSPNAQMVVISKSDCRILMARGLQPVYNYIDDEMKIQEKNIAKHDIQYVSMGNINYMTDIKSNQQVEENDVDHLGIRQRTGVIIANAILTEKFGKKYHEDYQVGVVNDVTNEGWIIQTTGVKTRIAMMKKNTCEMIVLMGEK